MTAEAIQLTANQQKTQAGFLSLQLITASCHAILNTNFTAPQAKPDWFDDLNAKLDKAKINATDWIDNIAPALTASIPHQVIDYAATFEAAVEAINELYKNNPDASGKDNPTVMQASEILQALSGEVKIKVSNVDTMSKKLKDWGDKMQSSHDDLSKGAGAIQNTIIDLQTDIAKMDNSIKNNQDAIAALNKQVVYAQMAVGVGLFMLVAGVALCIATAGTAAVVAGGVAVLGAAAIIGGAITWGVIQHQIDDDYTAIATSQKQKNADKQQIIALQGIAMATNQAVASIELATSTLSDFRTTWALYQDELQGVQDKLDKGASMSSILMENMFTNAAQKEWKDAVKFATDLVKSTPPVDSKDIPIAPAKAA